MSITFPLDHSGVAPTNLVTGEIHSVNEAHFKDYFFLVPNFSPFYTKNFKATLTLNGVTVNLVEDVDFSFALPYVTGTRVTGSAMYGAVTLHNLDMSGLITIEYQTIGGDQIPDRLQVLTELADKAYNPRTTIWDILTNVPNALPPTPHYQDYDDFYGQEEVVRALGEIRDAILANSSLTQTEILKFLETLGSGGSTDYVKKTGDTMTGPLTLEGLPTENRHAATKEYVDLKSSSDDKLTTALSSYLKTDDAIVEFKNKLNKAGDTMTGPLTLEGSPTKDKHAVTKKYVDDFSTVVGQKFNEVDQGLIDVNNDRVTKSYVDEKVNELKAYTETVAGSVVPDGITVEVLEQQVAVLRKEMNELYSYVIHRT